MVRNEWEVLILRDVGKGIKAMRQQAGVTQRQLAKLAGVSNCLISRVEKSGGVTMLTLARLSHAAGMGMVVGFTRITGEGNVVTVEIPTPPDPDHPRS